MEEQEVLNFLFQLYMPFMPFFFLFCYIVTVEYSMTWEHYDNGNSRTVGLEGVEPAEHQLCCKC